MDKKRQKKLNYSDNNSTLSTSGMDADVQKILVMADEIYECFNRLERRGVKSFAGDGYDLAVKRYDSIKSAANTFRSLYGIDISALRAAFDKEYAEELEQMNRQAKGR